LAEHAASLGLTRSDSLEKVEQQFRQMLHDESSRTSDTARNRAFLNLLFAICDQVAAEKREQKAIDFDDMIHQGAETIRAGKWKSPYRQIMLDECQDLSRGRGALLQALLGERIDIRLFAVGDDWQSIYRFAGAHVGMITRFSDYFGHTHELTMDRSFRYNQRINDIAAKFIQKNPDQKSKEIAAREDSEAERVGPVVAVGVINQEGDYVSNIHQILGAAIDWVKERCDSEGETDVLVLCRYKHTQSMASRFRAPAGIKIRASTIHSAKGRESDYAIVLDAWSGSFGFPSEIEDDPVLNVLTPPGDSYPHAEERRLFYVALTRAKYGLVVVTRAEQPSSFVLELLGDKSGSEDSHGVIEMLPGSTLDIAKQPRCKHCEYPMGRRNKGGEVFLCCPNYKACPGGKEAWQLARPLNAELCWTA
jgi:DNA helicase-4